MNRSIALLGLLFLCLLNQWTDADITIASADGQPEYYMYSQIYLKPRAVSWTQSQTYTDVTVSAYLQPTGLSAAYLTNSLGPGTGSANLMASPVYVAGFPAGYDPIFTALTLPAGTYYLTFYEPGYGPPSNLWATMPMDSVTFTTAPGVTIGSSVISSNGTIPEDGSGFPPADDSFAPILAPNTYLFEVTGARPLPNRQPLRSLV